jgi:rhodanese-related sulfurtransferase
MKTIILFVAVGVAACNSVHSNSNIERQLATLPTPSPVQPVAQQQSNDGVRRVTTAELDELMKQGKVVVVDVRNQQAYDLAHITGAKLIPVGQVGERAKELPRDKMIVTYCSWPKEQTSAGAVGTLKQQGFTNAAALLGGFQLWEKEGRPVIKKQWW